MGAAGRKVAALRPPGSLGAAELGVLVAVHELELRFHRAMIRIYEDAKRDAGYTATRFLQMISERGGLATARQLVVSSTPSDG